MGENSNFSIYSSEMPTNNNINVLFSPNAETTSYTYTVYKNDEIYETNSVIGNQSTNITLKDTGTFQIVAEVNDNNGPSTLESGLYLIDKDAPVINVSVDKLEIQKGEDYHINITANDNYDGDITNLITSNIDSLNFNEIGHKQLTYTVSDEAGNTTSKTVDINVTTNNTTLLLVQMILIILLLFVVLVFLKFKKTLNLEKRIEPYALSPKYGKKWVLMDFFVSRYKQLNHKISNVLKKSVFATKYAKKLDKYTVVAENHKEGLEILSLKVLTALLLVIVAFISNVIQMQFMPLYEVGMPLLVGFFIPDVVYFFKYKVYRNALENDLLSAIIIMNNAFKSGRNIAQAIEIVGNELDGLIAKEFKKMSLELSYGLDIDIIFKRFAKRVDIEEVNYLTASLTVLNKTGGNIIEVFSSIEKTMFNKKKLRLELASLTGSSRIIVYVLLGIPFFFILVISLLNPSYFLPFVTTDLGLVLLGIMIIYYILFIIVVRRIMKVVI